MHMQEIAPSPLPAVLHHLQFLPRELVHQVLDDLPILKVLQILSHNNSLLNSFVFSHLRYQNVFPAPTDAASVVELFILHRQICKLASQPLSGKNSPAGDSVLLRNISISAVRISPSNLRNNLIWHIRRSLEFSALPEVILSPYASGRLPELWHDRCADFRARWEWFENAIRKINKAKADQQRVLAELMSESPYKYMLKKTLDPSQDGPRPNTAHISNNFRSRAEKIMRNTKITRFEHWGPKACFSGVDLIEMVPYDRYLQLFMTFMKQHPFGSHAFPDLNVSDKLQNVSLIESADLEPLQRSDGFRYPDDIAAKIKVVQDGLMHIYTGSPLLVLPRIQWDDGLVLPRIQGGDGNEPKPSFFIHTKKHALNLPLDVHRCEGRRFRPHDDREYEWLRAFLKVVVWMERNLDVPGEEKSV